MNATEKKAYDLEIQAKWNLLQTNEAYQSSIDDSSEDLEVIMPLVDFLGKTGSVNILEGNYYNLEKAVMLTYINAVGAKGKIWLSQKLGELIREDVNNLITLGNCNVASTTTKSGAPVLKLISPQGSGKTFTMDSTKLKGEFVAKAVTDSTLERDIAF